MVSGIDSENLEKLNKSVKYDFLELKENVNKLNSLKEQMISNYEGLDLNFLYEDFILQLEQLDNINNKIENYTITFDNIINGYKRQASYIGESANLYLEKEEDKYG